MHSFDNLSDCMYDRASTRYSFTAAVQLLAWVRQLFHPVS